MKDLYIADITQAEFSGQLVSIELGVRDRVLKTAKNGQEMMILTFVDKTGQIDGVWFDPFSGENLFANLMGRCGSATLIDCVVRIEGRTGSYRGQAQIVVESLQVITEYDPADFQPTTKYNIDELVGILMQYVGKLEDADVKCLIEEVLSEPGVATAFRRSPAGVSVHHNFIGGLLEHVVSMTRAAWALCNHYKRLDRSILVAGCVLHDIGKIEELKTGLSFTYTTKGSLIGHIPIGFGLIERVASRIGTPEEKKLAVQHLVLSHHGTLEHGAARIPSTPEAVALSMIDVLDARLEQMFRMIDTAPATDEWTGFVPQLDTRVFCGSKQPVQEAVNV